MRAEKIRFRNPKQPGSDRAELGVDLYVEGSERAARRANQDLSHFVPAVVGKVRGDLPVVVRSSVNTRIRLRVIADVSDSGSEVRLPAQDGWCTSGRNEESGKIAICLRCMANTPFRFASIAHWLPGG
jgi:hypothetical protein